MVKTATRSSCPSKPKTAWHRSFLSTYLLEICAKQSSSALSIVYTPIQKIWSAWSTQAQYDCIRRRFQLMFLFYANYNSKLAPPGDDKRFYSHDVSVMSRWHDDDRIIAVQPMVMCFYWENQVSVAPKDVYRPSIFYFPHPYSLALAVNNSPAVFCRARSTDFEEKIEGLWTGETSDGIANACFLRANYQLSQTFIAVSF